MDQPIQLRIDWELDDGKRAEFVNHLLISSDGNNFALRFYQVLPPALDPNDVEAIQKITTVKAHHIVTLAISAASMPAIVKALQEVLDGDKK